MKDLLYPIRRVVSHHAFPGRWLVTLSCGHVIVWEGPDPSRKFWLLCPHEHEPLPGWKKVDPSANYSPY